MTVPISPPPVNLACPDCGEPRFVFDDPETGPELVCEGCFRAELTAKAKAECLAFNRQYRQTRRSIFRKVPVAERKRVYRVSRVN